MPVPSSIDDLSTTAASNSPAGSESPTTTDDYLRALSAFIASLRDGSGFSATGLTEIREAALVSGTAKASTSGTAVDFTSIPSGVRRITLLLSGVSTSGTSNLLVQIGDSGGIEATGYAAIGVGLQELSTATAAPYTTGFGLPFGNAANVMSGAIVLTLMDASTNTWIASGNVAQTTSTTFVTCAGSKSLSATLDRVRLTTVNGTDTFDLGSVNIVYE